MRDLSTGQTLLALPCSDERADTEIAALNRLLLEHVAPRVLKSDNGSAFVADSIEVPFPCAPAAVE